MTEIEQQKKRIKKLEKENEALKVKMDKLEQKVAQLALVFKGMLEVAQDEQIEKNIITQEKEIIIPS